MTKPPPADLKDWSKNELRREVERLRAVMREHAEQRGDDPRSQAAGENAVVDVAGDPDSRHGALLDVRKAVLMETIDVSLLETGRDSPAVFLVLGGRVNYAEDVVNHAYLMSAEGAAGIASEIVGLASRANKHPETAKFAQEFLLEFNRRASA